MDIPSSVNPMQRMIIEHANRIVGDFNGEPITRLQRLLLTLDTHAHEKPQLAKTLLDLYSQAAKDNEQTSILVLRAALAYKEEMGPIFAAAEKAGRSAPPIYPHPDDVIIRSDGSVLIDGPRTAQEARELDTMLQYRDALFFVVEETMDLIGEFRSADEGRRKWVSYRGQFYRFHRRIPRRLYKPFPQFRTMPRDYPESCE